MYSGIILLECKHRKITTASQTSKLKISGTRSLLSTKFSKIVLSVHCSIRKMNSYKRPWNMKLLVGECRNMMSTDCNGH
ncbi:hypothetical protein ANTPLA_LOCUS6716 [Anthophora plagiata]